MQRHQRVRFRGEQGTVQHVEGRVAHVKLDSGEDVECYPGEAEPISEGALRIEWVGIVPILKGRKAVMENGEEVGIVPFSLLPNTLLITGCRGTTKGRGQLDFQSGGEDYGLVVECGYQELDDVITDYLLEAARGLYDEDDEEYDEDEEEEDPN